MYHCMANLSVYLRESSDSKSFDLHLRYSGKLQRFFHLSASREHSLWDTFGDKNGSGRSEQGPVKK